MHPALAQQNVVHEQMPLVHRAPVFRERRAHQRGRNAHAVGQRVKHLTDVAFRRAVEGRADLEDDLACPLRQQPVAGGKRCGHGITHRRCAAFERDNASIQRAVGRSIRHADELGNAHAGLRQG